MVLQWGSVLLGACKAASPGWPTRSLHSGRAPRGPGWWAMTKKGLLKPGRRESRKAQLQHFARRDQADAGADQHVTEKVRRQQRARHRQDRGNGEPQRRPGRP